jgi:hypothetical protein
MSPSNDRNIQLVLPTTQRERNSSTSSDNKVNLKKDGIQHMLRSKRQNIINLELTAANIGLRVRNRKRKRKPRVCDSGLAAKRLKALQARLAEEWTRKELLKVTKVKDLLKE